MDKINDGHYKQGGVEPIQYIEANQLDFKRGNIVKYVSRDKFKNRDEDIKKAISYAAYILKYDYGYTDKQIAEHMLKTFVTPFLNNGG